MVVAGRRKSIAFFIALGIGLIAVTVLLYVGWGLLNWHHGILLVLGILLMLVIISGVGLNTVFLVREIRRNEQHDAFINAVTHELKTPVASIRLYLETLQTRPVEESKRKEFYRIMLEDSDRLRPLVVETRRGIEQFQKIREALGRLELSDGMEFASLLFEVSPRLPRDATLIAILPRVEIETSMALGVLRRQGFAITALLIGLEDDARSQAHGRLLAEKIRDVRNFFFGT